MLFHRRGFCGLARLHVTNTLFISRNHVQHWSTLIHAYDRCFKEYVEKCDCMASGIVIKKLYTIINFTLLPLKWSLKRLIIRKLNLRIISKMFNIIYLFHLNSSLYPDRVFR